jgi:outer membrane receptor protein involved in Fe transport
MSRARGFTASLRAIAAVLCLGGLAVPGAHAQAPVYGSINGRVIDRDTGQPLRFANIVIVGTTLGANAPTGAFNIAVVPVGTYTLKASFVGYETQTLVDIRVDAGKPTTVEFKLKKDLDKQIDPIKVRGQQKQIDVKSSDVSHVTTDKEMLSLPVESVTEAVALNTGVVVAGGELHVRGGRSNEVSVRIDGVPVDDPLSGGSVDLGLLSVAQSELITGGMDAEYGNASSAIINYTTKSGGRNFEGNFRYTTDDYGRADKTFTNYDRVSLGVGGPTPFNDLTYYVSGEATFFDGEVLTVKNYPEHKYLNGLIKVKERSDTNFRTQSRLDWKVSKGVKMSGEMTLDRTSSDPYVHNWNTAGYVSRILIFPQIGVNRFSPRFYTVVGSVLMYAGPWYEQALNSNFIDIREAPDCTHCLVPTSDNQTLRAVRVVDFQGRGSDPNQPPLYALIDFLIFDGYQNPISEWVPDLGVAPGDSNKTQFNAAEHMWTNKNLSYQFKWAMTHTLSPKSFYEVKLSRLSFDVLSTVNNKTPGEFDTAGKFIWVPNRGPTTVGNVDYYTDPDNPYFAIAYDYPRYARRNTKTYLLRSDITTQRWKNHKVKGGLLLQYNDLDNSTLTSPGRQRQFRDPYGFSRNVFHNFNPEGSLYTQDRWEYEGMVVNGGVRFDFFSPGSGVGVEINSNEIQRDVDRWKSQWSPRLGLAFPITDRDVFHFHYGRFIQFPEKNLIFATQDVNAGLGTLGNPNLDPETSISYQAGIKHQFSTDVSGQFALFNKDYYGLVSSIEITDDSTGTQNLRYVNKAYASSRGIELQLNKSFSRNFAFDLAYTFSYADGVASDTDFGRAATGLAYLPTGELPLDWDQRHTFNATVSIARAGDWSATTVYQYSSGLPWTPFFRFERRQDPLDENSRRFPQQHLVNFRGEKYFKIYGQDLRLFFDGRNLLDEKVVVDLSPLVFPALENATDGYLAYATERNQFGGAYLRDSDGDGQDEFFPVNDPRVFGQRRLFRIGLGFEF